MEGNGETFWQNHQQCSYDLVLGHGTVLIRPGIGSWNSARTTWYWVMELKRAEKVEICTGVNDTTINELPVKIRTTTSLASFRTSLNTHLFKLACMISSLS